MSAPAARALPGVVAASAIVGVCVANGGYFPTSWGWAALGGLLVVVVGALVLESFDLARGDIAFVSLLGAYTTWVALSALWAPSPAQPVLEVERTLVYLALACALALVTTRRSAPAVVVGVYVATLALSAYALATRLVPAHVGTFSSAPPYLLAGPLGYSNALGLVAAFAALLAYGIVTRARDRAVRAAVAASLLVSLPTLYFTFSRGATAALVVGVLVAFALDPRRLRFSVAVAASTPLPAAAVVVASRAHALTRPGSTLGAAVHDGRRLLALLVVLAAANAAIGAFALADRPVAPRVRRAYVAALAVVAAGAVAVILVEVGNPVSFANRATDAFRSSSAAPSDLNQRLFTLSGHNRSDYWRVAWHEYRAHPVLGAGAGSFARWWLRERPTPFGARNAHDLYLETLADLGPVGLVLLVGALAVPLVALRRARRAELGAVAGAAYAMFLVHVTIEWDWQLTGVGIAALACAVAVLALARPAGAGAATGIAMGARIAVVAGAIALALFALLGQLGNNAARASQKANARSEWGRAARLARRARRFEPWSYEPWLLLGQAQLGAGDLAGARRSFRAALSRDRGDWSVWYGLGLATSGRARALAFAEARRLNPRDPGLAAASKG